MQATASYKAAWRAPTSLRNISNPYNLAIPPKSQRRSQKERADTPKVYLDPPERSSETMQSQNSSRFLEVPKPTKEVIVTEKVIRTGPYSRNTTFRSSLYTPTNQHVPEDRKPRVDNRVLAIAVTFTLAILLAIGIPLGAILPQKYIKPLPINVLVPFYVNPEAGAWGRLYDTIIQHHDKNFTVIINPDNSPGSSTWPSAPIIDAVKQLNIYPNVRTLGYINAAQGTRDEATVKAEIATYAGWSKVTEGLAIHGVFLDKTPWNDDDEGIAKAWLRNVSVAVRQAGWAGSDEGTVVHNPGRVPDEGLMAYRPDMAVVFEGKYGDLPAMATLHDQLAKANGDRAEYAMLVHSVPTTLDRSELRGIVESVRKDIEWLYLTDLTDDMWSDYASIWDQWLDVAW